ncbi:MAG: hypothetical protein GX760_04320 [Erysipelothrix sp.]|nr:hypothetical protein [Erysipelothrix sp.]
MKGVVFSTTFFVLIFVIFLSFSNYIYFDHNRSLINRSFKSALIQTAEIQSESQDNFDTILDTFLLIIEDNLPKGFDYSFSLYGYHQDPLLIRIKLSAKSKHGNYHYEMEETIVQKEAETNE